MVAAEPIATLAGSAEHEIVGGRGDFTVNSPLHEAMWCLLPSLKLALTRYEPGCKLAVSICVDAPDVPGFTALPLHSYLIVRLGLKFDPVAVAVTGSPANTSFGCTEQEALEAGSASPPPNFNTRPVWSLSPLKSVVAVVLAGP